MELEMTCPSDQQIKEQAKATTPEPWFTLHLLLCEECLLQFIIRQACQALCDEERADPYFLAEPVDPLARDWMLWMTGDRFPDSDTIQ